MIDLRLGDCLEIMRDMPAASVDAVITDPPYGLDPKQPATAQMQAAHLQRVRHLRAIHFRQIGYMKYPAC